MFEVAAENYGRFMGRFSEPLAEVFADQVGPRQGQRVLDVGCGPGALIGQLVARVGDASVSAVDPSRPFVDAAKRKFSDVNIREAFAEELPYADDTFDASLAALVVHFMSDPVAGLREMGRVTRPGGAVAACVWDYAGDTSPLSAFWQAVTDLEPAAKTESKLAGAREGHLVELSESAGLRDAVGGYLTVQVPMASFEEWWEPFTLGVGPAGVHVRGLDEAGRDRLRDRCRELLPPAPFEVSASAWSVTAIV